MQCINIYLKKRMILKIDTMKESENELITSFTVGPADGRTDNVINNLIIVYLNYINN